MHQKTIVHLWEIQVSKLINGFGKNYYNQIRKKLQLSTLKSKVNHSVSKVITKWIPTFEVKRLLKFILIEESNNNLVYSYEMNSITQWVNKYANIAYS